MAGNRQHHVWQMLQRGFGEKRGKDHHVWVYRKAEPAERTVTRLFGVEPHFYGPEGSEVDAKITTYENENQSMIQDIRKSPHGTEVDPEFAGALIAHLEIRSAFFRQEVSTKMQSLTAGLVQRFRTPKKLRAMALAYLKENPDELNKFLGKRFIPPNQRANMAEIACQMIEIIPDDELVKSIEPVFIPMRELSDQSPETMKAVQSSVFVENMANEVRAKLHLDRDYYVHRSESEAFILPDTTLAFVTKTGASPFFQKNDVVEGVILPIASDVAIIGKTKKFGVPAVKSMNRLLAGCSYEAFLAQERNAQFQGLTGRIGKYAELISDRALRDLAKG